MTPSEAQALRTLLETRPVAALATLHKGEPAVSMVPYALMPGSTRFVIHVSRLATHTQDMLAHAAVALLVTDAEANAETPLALPRASIQGQACMCAPDSPEYAAARAAYLAKRPDGEPLFSFSDFALFVIETRSVRYVAGFGRAVSIMAEQLAPILGAGE